MHLVNPLFGLWSGLFSFDGTAGLTGPLIDAVRKYQQVSKLAAVPEDSASAWLAVGNNGCVWKLTMMCVKFPLSAIQLVSIYLLETVVHLEVIYLKPGGLYTREGRILNH